MCLRYVDGIVSVTEEEIFAAMRVMLMATKLVAEPSGAVTLAAALFHADELPTVKKVAVVLSGGNLEPALRELLESELAATCAVNAFTGLARRLITKMRVESYMRDRLLNWFGWGVVLLVSCGSALGTETRKINPGMIARRGQLYCTRQTCMSLRIRIRNEFRW